MRTCAGEARRNTALPHLLTTAIAHYLICAMPHYLICVIAQLRTVEQGIWLGLLEGFEVADQ